MREQVPQAFRFLDDRWGLTWRIINRLKKINLKTSWRFETARFRQIRLHCPIFIIGVPRSGTTSVFRLLGEHRDLASLGHEGHDCWRRYHHPRRRQWRSDQVGPNQVTARERSFVNRYFYARLGEGRFVEKTPCNSFRVPYLLDLFPDAHFIWVKRDPRASISSMINGWTHPLARFRTYYVPDELEIPGYDYPHTWCFGLIEGWRELRRASIPEIVREQWRQYVRGAECGRRMVAQEKWNELCFEDLLEDPLSATRHLLNRLGLGEDEAVVQRARSLRSNPTNTMKGSGPGDWRENEQAVQAMLPDLRAEIELCGYDPDALPKRRAAVAST